jgi:hypothetical protein
MNNMLTDVIHIPIYFYCDHPSTIFSSPPASISNIYAAAAIIHPIPSNPYIADWSGEVNPRTE